MVVTVFALTDDASELVFFFFLSLANPGGTLGYGVNFIQGVVRLG
jgi:hypothetical protein